MIKARTSGPAYSSGGKVAVPIDFFDDAAPGVVVDSTAYFVTPDASAITKLTALIIEGINIRRDAANGVAGFNQAVPVGTVVG